MASYRRAIIILALPMPNDIADLIYICQKPHYRYLDKIYNKPLRRSEMARLLDHPNYCLCFRCLTTQSRVNTELFMYLYNRNILNGEKIRQLCNARIWSIDFRLAEKDDNSPFQVGAQITRLVFYADVLRVLYGHRILVYEEMENIMTKLPWGVRTYRFMEGCEGNEIPSPEELIFLIKKAIPFS